MGQTTVWKHSLYKFMMSKFEITFIILHFISTTMCGTHKYDEIGPRVSSSVS